MDNDKLGIKLASTTSNILLCSGAGFIKSGIISAVLGGSACAVDEYLIAKNYTTKHYFGSFSFYNFIVIEPLLSRLSKKNDYFSDFIYLASIPISSFFAYFTHDFINIAQKIELPIKSTIILNNILNNTNNILSISYLNPISLFDSFNNKFLNNLIFIMSLKMTREFFKFLFANSLGSYTKIPAIINIYNQYKIESLTNEKFSLNQKVFKALNILFIIMFGKIIDLGLDFASNYYSSKLNQNIILKGTAILLENGAGGKIIVANHKEGKYIVENFVSDLIFLFKNSQILLEEVTSIFSLFLNLFYICRYTNNSILPSMLITILTKELYLVFYSSKKQDISSVIHPLISKIGIYIHNIISNSDRIFQSDGTEFMIDKLSFLKLKIAKLEHSLYKLDQLENLVNIINNFAKDIFDTIFLLEIKPPRNQLLRIIEANSNILEQILKNSYRKINDHNNLQVLRRVEKFFYYLNIPHLNALKFQSTNNNILIKNYSLYLEANELFHIDYLEFETGKKYAITGASGCGKSSLMIDLKVGLQGVVSSFGEIYLPEGEIIFIDQDIYIPPEATLIELIYYPKNIHDLNPDRLDDLKSKAVKLFKELKIDSFVQNNLSNTGSLINKLDSSSFKLSGGQKQKILLIKAIIHQPSIVIIDESLARMDEKSVVIFLNSINKYLSNATLLIIDHKAKHHNFNGFFHQEIHIEENKIFINQLDPIEEPINIINTNDSFDSEALGICSIFDNPLLS